MERTTMLILVSTTMGFLGCGETNQTPEANEEVVEVVEVLESPSDALQSELRQLWRKDAYMAAAVGWRKLAAFLPSSVDGFGAEGEAEGETTRFARSALSEVARRYTRDEAKLLITITDTARAPMMRAPFLSAELVDEDSSRGYQHALQIDGWPGIEEWDSEEHRSIARMLVNDRYLVWVEVDGADAGDQARRVAATLDTAQLAVLKEEAASPERES